MKSAATVSLLLVLSIAQTAAAVIVEPDNYANGTVLTSIVPEVFLYTTASDNFIIPLFEVTAETESIAGAAPTGTKVFAHSGIGFWNNERRLYMAFNGLTSSVSIQFGGGSAFTPEFGRLEIFNNSNQLMGSYTTAGRLRGQFETMTLTRPQADIDFAIAYVPDGMGSFGRLDGLTFATPVPEPATWILGAMSAVAVAVMKFRRGRAPR